MLMAYSYGRFGSIGLKDELNRSTHGGLDMSEKRIFSPEELEHLATPLSIQLERAAEREDFDDMKRIQQLMDQECLCIHEPYVNWIAALESYIVYHLGEDRLEEAMRWAGQMAMKPVWSDLMPLDRKGQIEYLASRWRASGSTIFVEEDDEKVTFRMEPCGDGHRLLRDRGDWNLQREIQKISRTRLKYPDQGAYQAPKHFVFLNTPRCTTHGRSPFPVFCAGCVLFNEILATDVFGYPLWIAQTPEQNPNEKPCVLHLYKDPRDVPLGAYMQIGKARPRSWKKTPRIRRLFTDEEMEEMGIPLSLRLERAVESRDLAAIQGLARIMDAELVRAKDPQGIFIAGLLSYIARNLGEEKVEEVLHWVAELIMSPFFKDIEGLDKKTEIEMWCMVWRAHGSTFWVEEEDDKFVFRGKPLGACHRMWSSAYQPKVERISPDRVRYPTFGCYMEPGSCHLMREPRGITTMKENYPVYSTHCHMLHEIFAIEQRGYPIWIEVHPLDSRDEETVHIHYKEPQDWPEEVYKNLGLERSQWLRELKK
jgi:hypothetical protein